MNVWNWKSIFIKLTIVANTLNLNFFKKSFNYNYDFIFSVTCETKMVQW